MDLPKRIELIEVCPRDGFQSVHDIIPFEGKVAIIKKLAEAGFKRLEVVSFVSPKAIPQMADAKEVVAAVRDTLKAHGVRTVAPVSYTHLDVYKRQVPQWPRPPRWRDASPTPRPICDGPRSGPLPGYPNTGPRLSGVAGSLCSVRVG